MPDSALYPSPPQQSQGLLQGDPLRIIGAMRELQSLGLQQQQIPALAQTPATELAGKQQSIELQRRQLPALAQTPATELAGKTIANTTAAFEQQAKAQQIISSFIAGQLGGKKDVTADDVLAAATSASRIFPQIQHTFPSLVNNVADIVLKEKRGIPVGIATLRNMGLSPAEASTMTEGPPDPVTGQPMRIPMQESNILGARPTQLPPGEADALSASAQRGADLAGTAKTTAQYHSDLDNLKQLNTNIPLAGPAAEWEKKLNQTLSRFGISGTLTADQLKNAEEFAKIANQISLNQSTMFHGSDAGLHTVISANPSLEQSKYGREGVIDMLHGNQDAIDVARKEWSKFRASGDETHKGPQPFHSFDNFMDSLSDRLDPRVFQFNRMSRDNQQKFLHSMDQDDLDLFINKYNTALQSKWVKPMKKAP